MISDLNFNLIDFDDQVVNYISNGFFYYEISEKNQSIIKITSLQEKFPITSGLFIKINLFDFLLKIKGSFTLRNIRLLKSPLNCSFFLYIFTEEILNENYIIREKLYPNDLIINESYQYIIPIKISHRCPSNKFYEEAVSFCHSCEMGTYFQNNTCIKCPIEAHHCSDNTITPKLEYFIDNAKNIYPCAPFKDSCL